jgi:hypothetical protein
MGTETLLLIGLAVFLAGYGVVCFAAKDWLWERHEANLRARGIASAERTPEWENQQNWLGGASIVVALVLVVLALS